MDAGMAGSDVGRNKAIQAHRARWRFRRVREVFAGNAGSRCRSNRLIPAYFYPQTWQVLKTCQV